MLRMIAIAAFAITLAGCGHFGPRGNVIHVASGVDANGNVIWETLDVNTGTHAAPESNGSLSTFNPFKDR